MKKRGVSLILALCMCLGLVPAAAAANAWDGSADTAWYDASRTEFILYTAEELAGLASLVNAGNTFHGKMITLGADIDLGNKSWIPIGSGSAKPFKGCFDGAGHFISGLQMETLDTNCVGLFGYVIGATVRNITVADGQVTSSNKYVAGLVACADAGSLISNCHNAARITGEGIRVGGICANAVNSTIISCRNMGIITLVGGNGHAGGIVGYAGGTQSSCIEDCVNQGAVTGRAYTGGICGNASNCTVERSCNHGVVTGEHTSSGADEGTGGIIGRGVGSRIFNCYNSKPISGKSYVGGMIGNQKETVLANCHNVGAVAGRTAAAIIGSGGADAATNCYYLEDCAEDLNAIPKTAAEFRNGTVCGLLQGAQEDRVWGQTIGTDAWPVFYDGTNQYVPPVAVAGVAVQPDTLMLEPGEAYTLTAVVEPADADEQGVTWRSANESVAAVDENGKVTAGAEGGTVITATTEDGGFTASCAIRVHRHQWTYARTGAAAVTAACRAGCGVDGGSVTLRAPAHRVCGDGLDTNAKLEGALAGLVPLPGIWYQKRTGSGWVLCAPPVDAGTYRAGVTINDPDEAFDLTVEYTVAKAGLTVSGTGVAYGTYGQKLSMLSVSGLTVWSGGQEVAGAWTLSGDAVPAVGDSGTYLAVFTPAENAENYEPLTAPVTLSIGKAVYSGAHHGAAAAVLPGGSGRCDLAAYYTDLPAGCVFGTPGIEGSALSGAPVLRGSVLTFTAAGDAKTDDVVIITVPVTCSGYEDFSLTLTVTVSGRQAQESFGFPVSVRGAVYGDGDFVLPASGAVPGSAVAYASSDPTVAAVDPLGGVVTVTGAGSAVITASAAGTAEYLPKTVSYTLTVAPRELLIRADDRAATAGSKPPALTYTVRGLVHGDALLAEPVLTVDADMHAAGAYPITAGGADAGKNYTITYESGTLTVGEAPVVEAEPESVSLRVRADGDLVGYEIVVRDENGDPVRLKRRASGHQTFEVPAGGADIEIEVALNGDTLAQLAAQVQAAGEPAGEDAGALPTLPFDDVQRDDGCYEAVAFVYARGLMGGNGRSFDPGGSLSRATAARMFYALEDYPMTGCAGFTDVPRGEWYTDAVDWAASVGVITGGGDGGFDPHGAVSREQLAVMLYNYAVGKRYYVEIGGAETAPMTGVSPWAARAVAWADAFGILPARDAAAPATRADVAQAFLNFSERFG